MKVIIKLYIACLLVNITLANDLNTFYLLRESITKNNINTTWLINDNFVYNTKSSDIFELSEDKKTIVSFTAPNGRYLNSQTLKISLFDIEKYKEILWKLHENSRPYNDEVIFKKHEKLIERVKKEKNYIVDYPKYIGVHLNKNSIIKRINRGSIAEKINLKIGDQFKNIIYYTPTGKSVERKNNWCKITYTLNNKIKILMRPSNLEYLICDFKKIIKY